MSILDSITPSDLPFEESLLENPADESVWLSYVAQKREDENPEALTWVLSRAVRKVPHSYELWSQYISQLESDPAQTLQAYSDASLYLGEESDFWLGYCNFLIDHLSYIQITEARHVFDSALRKVPNVQHGEIWKPYLQFADKVGGPIRFYVYHRYMEYVTFMTGKKEVLVPLEECLSVLISTASTVRDVHKLRRVLETVFGDPILAASLTSSPFDPYMQFFDVLVQAKVGAQDAESLYNFLLSRYPDQFGTITVKLALYYSGNLFKAISAYEQGLAKCMTLKDFTVIYDSYIEYVDRQVEEQEDPDLVEFTMGTYESLIGRRSLLINDIRLRQNKNDVESWMERVRLLADSPQKVSQCYNDAILTINAVKVKKEGVLSKLWMQYVDSAGAKTADRRKLLAAAVKVPFQFVSDLEEVWSYWVQKELDAGEFDHAITVIRQAVTLPQNVSSRFPDRTIRYNDETLSAQIRARKSVKLWSLYLDLVESASEDATTYQRACGVYEEVIRLKVATPNIILNYCHFMEDNGHIEDAFRVYERGASLFRTNALVYEIWKDYLDKAVQYQSELKLPTERIRDMFSQAVDVCHKKSLYLAYAEYEEKHGSSLESLQVLHEATSQEEDQVEIFKLLAEKTLKYKGVSAAGEVYQEALEKLPVNAPGFLDIVDGFVSIEAKQSHLKRCRQILKYSGELVMKYGKSQKLVDHFWDMFKEFELEHGNETSYKEMLRFKRKLQENYKPVTTETGGIGFVKADAPAEEKTTNASNGDEIELDMSDMEDL